MQYTVQCANVKLQRGAAGRGGVGGEMGTEEGLPPDLVMLCFIEDSFEDTLVL